ncbi:MAG: TonB-dependent receptor [Lysobacterales bacterium]
MLLKSGFSRSIAALTLPALFGFASLSGAEPVHKPGHAHQGAPTVLDDITVTADPLRGDGEALSTPVEILAGSDLDDARGATLGETLERLPGVQSSNFGPGVGRPIIRGLDGSRVAILSGGLASQDVSTVSQDHAVAIEPFLADQIEVLKGPATLLFGSGAIGGVVNVVDGRIPEQAVAAGFGGRAEVRLDTVNDGNTEMFRVDGGGAGFALHADGVYRNNRSYDIPDGKQANSALETKTGAAGGSVLGEWGFLGASASRFLDSYGNPGEPGDPLLGEPGVRIAIEQNRYEVKGGWTAPFSGVDMIRASFAHTDYQHTEFEGNEIGTRFIKDADEGRLEISHPSWSGWTGALGLQVVDSAFSALGEEAFVPPTSTEAYGVFLVEKRSWERFTLDLGARVDSVESNPSNDRSRNFTPVSVSLGGRFEPSEHWDLSFNLDHAERAPAEEELFANGPHVATSSFEIGDPQLRTEASNQVEIGAHYHGPRVQAKLAAYSNYFHDFVFLADTGLIEDELPVRNWRQSDAHFRGWEAEATVVLADGARARWSLRGFGDRVRATLSDGGGNVPRIAPSRAGAELAVEAGGWRAALRSTYVARQNHVADNETETAGYTLIDADLAWHFDRQDIGWELFVNARNLGDRAARVHTSFLKDRVQLPGIGASIGVRAFF